MEYRRRVKGALCAAVAIHILLLLLPEEWGSPYHSPGTQAAREPIVINLMPEKEPRRLIDAGAPAEEPVGETDLIAEQASNAADVRDTSGERAAPRFDEPSEFDRMARAPQPEQKRPAHAEAARSEARTQPEEAPEQPGEEEDAALQAVPGKQPSQQDEEPQDGEEPMQLAKAAGVSNPEEALEPEGRPDGGAENKGFIGFEAKHDEFASYLKDVQREVEKRWKALIQMRYSGTRPTKVQLDCSISPKGELVYVRIADKGDVPVFAHLCKQALEEAAPFPSFPFTVPAIYRSDNLQIRWTFSFLRR